jgi:hypothetical protein
VQAVFPVPSEDGEVAGTVRFSFNVDQVFGEIEIDTPYFGKDGIDAGVKEAANYLAGIAEALSDEARSLSGSGQSDD